MGKVVAQVAGQRNDCAVVAGIDLMKVDRPFPVFTSPEEVNVPVDVVVDFSHPSVLTPLLSFATKQQLPVVLCTTGYSKVQVEEICEASKKIPVFYSGNMSLGINLLIALAQKAATVFGEAFDIEIVEKHHNQKIDAPSGTALMIADGISSVLEKSPQYVYDRHSYRRPRGKHEIGIHSVRGGSIVGEHEVIFAGHDEVLTISHTAQSKEIFASGAVNAARFMTGKAAGMYQMSDLLADKAEEESV
jgi:4-hydroxy-tetrahydrodipicolinate reductase